MHRTARPALVLACAALLAAASAGCTVYRPEVRQGNFLEEAKLAQVQPGMTREQVEFLLGPPMLVDPFHRDRWDYVFTLSSELTNHQVISKHFVVLFDGDRVRETKTLD
jgi:outer membrane protein assembly factor BamE